MQSAIQRLVFASLLGVGSVLQGAEPAALGVMLRASAASPQPVGSSIGLIPVSTNAKRGTYTFRYSVSVNGGPFRVVRDFSQASDFVWTPDLVEQEARVRVSVRGPDAKDKAEAEMPFRVVSRVTGGQVTVTPTAHPLVALLSAPACATGSQFRAAFRAAGAAQCI